MIPIIVYTRKKIFKNYTGFSFFIFIWISRMEKFPERLIRHEKIHFLQQVEMLFLFHWFLYALFYIISRFKGQGHYIGYRYNPFELEAYGNDLDSNYLHTRKAFAWVKYIKDFRAILGKDMSAHIPKQKEIGW